jgi:hypothetical protein
MKSKSLHRFLTYPAMNSVTLLFISLTLSALLILPATGQVPSGAGYRLDWFTLDGGGGTCSGGGYTLNGTIGQHDAATAASAPGATYRLEPGFWAAVLPTPDAPELRMRLSGNNAILWWPSGTGHVLQQSMDLVSWEDVAEEPVASGQDLTVIQPAGEEMRRFYRLRAALSAP